MASAMAGVPASNLGSTEATAGRRKVVLCPLQWPSRLPAGLAEQAARWLGSGSSCAAALTQASSPQRGLGSGSCSAAAAAAAPAPPACPAHRSGGLASEWRPKWISPVVLPPTISGSIFSSSSYLPGG